MHIIAGINTTKLRHNQVTLTTLSKPLPALLCQQTLCKNKILGWEAAIVCCVTQRILVSLGKHTQAKEAHRRTSNSPHAAFIRGTNKSEISITELSHIVLCMSVCPIMLSVCTPHHTAIEATSCQHPSNASPAQPRCCCGETTQLAKQRPYHVFIVFIERNKEARGSQ